MSVKKKNNYYSFCVPKLLLTPKLLALENVEDRVYACCTVLMK